MKTQLLKKSWDQKELKEKIITAIRAARSDKSWNAKKLARMFRIHIELMEHYLVEMAQKGEVMIGKDHEGNLWVGGKE